ncbi:tryptophan synthase alpha chain [Motilibacter rhizosphaerae]|uniref:Tryptophan synthase alpha chain n=1 Tax=Motilibacter rhizosphaerae TaxID=598652 RepID=A0A4Q7NGC5_9ACTN|nr:tryptophan synthase subunit alpha [Motilibacter rhizosphaerae]RZS82875.1 tryptophan synthase alpha chain [Motilibacter rhizosphaerae]
MSALDSRLAERRAEGRAALVGYLPAGFPSPDGALAVARAMVEGGCDVIEVGLPYSDPVLDGPAIQQAVDQALRAGVGPKDVLRTVEAASSAGAATLVMTYWNPVERQGPERFAADLAAAGGSGVILPDLPPEEAGAWLSAAEDHGLDSVFLVAPSSSEERVAAVCAASSGFVYAASLMGVTGVLAVSSGARDLVARTRQHTDLPVCVGLGVSTPEQAEEVAAYADGVIVGTAFVRAVLEAPDEAAGAAAAGELAGRLAAGVRAGRS